MKNVAKKYIELGLNPLPIAKESKAPQNREHNTVPITLADINSYAFENIGISTGILSGGLEAIDFDLKNAKDPKAIMRCFKSKVPPKLLKKLLVQQTQSGGYHFIYRCEDVSSSKKLAKNDKGAAIIETRGEGGLIKCYPSEGYKVIQGSFENIPIITPEERLQLFVSAKMLNQLVRKDAYRRASREDLTYIEKFPEYNADQEIGIKLLKKHGWKQHSEDSDWINFTRPNSKSGDIHAGYHKEGKFFFCFSTAQDSFEEEKPYNNHAIYAELECGGNYSKAYAKLFEQGHGVEGAKQLSKKEVDELDDSDWDAELDECNFLSDELEENTLLEQFRKGEVEFGKSWGWNCLDEYSRFKPNSFNVSIGYDNTGKSMFMLSLIAASQTLHGTKWGLVCPENKTAITRRRLIEAKTGKDISYWEDSPAMFDKHLQESREYFKIVSNKKHYSITDALEMGKKLYLKYGIEALLLDPYSFFKTSGNLYEHNARILSELRVFSEKYCSVFLMVHPSSAAPRNNKDEYGYLKPPTKYDATGGNDFANRCDDFSIIHRVINHEDSTVRRTIQFIMEKVKETDSGGKVHDSGDFTSLIYETRNGFTGYWDNEGNNPMYKAQQAKLGVRAQMKGVPTITPEEAF